MCFDLALISAACAVAATEGGVSIMADLRYIEGVLTTLDSLVYILEY